MGIARSIVDVEGRGGKMKRFSTIRPETVARSCAGLLELEVGRNDMRKGTRRARSG
jgi:hypothetical protein